MKKSFHFFVFVISVILLSAFNIQQAVPADLLGRWKLRGQGSKLVGTLEIKSNGSYTYAVLPSFKESGTVTVDTRAQPNKINLIATRTGGGTNTTMGIYKITGNSLQLSLGKMNGDRPANFTPTAGSGIIVWNGSK